MTISEFGEKFTGYYARANGQVIREISRYMDRIHESYYDRIYDVLITEIPPNRTPGVADIKAVCEKIGAQVIYKSKHIDLRPVTVTCDCCGYDYLWAQGVGAEQTDNNIHGVCPRCKFPYIETVMENEYRKNGYIIKCRENDGEEVSAYEHYKNIFYREWKSKLNA